MEPKSLFNFHVLMKFMSLNDDKIVKLIFNLYNGLIWRKHAKLQAKLNVYSILDKSKSIVSDRSSSLQTFFFFFFFAVVNISYYSKSVSWTIIYTISFFKNFYLKELFRPKDDQIPSLFFCVFYFNMFSFSIRSMK